MSLNCISSFQRACKLGLILLLILAMTAGSASMVKAQTASAETSVILMLRAQAGLAQFSPARNGGTAMPRAQRIQGVVETLRAQAAATQPALLSKLETLRAAGKVNRVTPLWIVNAVVVKVRQDALSELANLPGVASVILDGPLKLLDNTPPTGALPNIQSAGTVSWNLTQINAPMVWTAGYSGQGMVVANLDSGVSLDNPDLAAKWRGGTNSWLDTHNQHATPFDAMGHGTGTMDIMVGSQTGVAPMAKWIAVKMFDDFGNAADSDALAGFQFVLDPDGDPATPDAPNVVNNSWADVTSDCSYNPAMRSAIQALAAANILPIFAAGNLDYSLTSPPVPASFPETFAVGAVDANNQLAYFSVKGPSTCRDAAAVYPDLSAPGVNIPFHNLDGTIATQFPGGQAHNGTSFAAPHVAGALAVLLSASPNMTITQQRDKLIASAIDLGISGPDSSYGYGGLDLARTFYPFNLYLPYHAKQ